jgi:RNAse (barnase) inhibitor barstar
MDYQELLIDPGAAGIFIAPADIEGVQAAAQQVGLSCWQIDLTGMRSKEELLAGFKRALPLPEYCADNWDALDESLSDHIWEQPVGAMLVLSNCGELLSSSTEVFETALEVLDTIGENCYDEDIPFWVFAQGVDSQLCDLPALTEHE